MDEANGIYKMILFFVTVNVQFSIVFIELRVLLYSLQAEEYTFLYFNFLPCCKKKKFIFKGWKRKV